jgi:hypothetical protein
MVILHFETLCKCAASTLENPDGWVVQKHHWYMYLKKANESIIVIFKHLLSTSSIIFILLSREVL